MVLILVPALLVACGDSSPTPAAAPAAAQVPALAADVPKYQVYEAIGMVQNKMKAECSEGELTEDIKYYGGRYMGKGVWQVWFLNDATTWDLYEGTGTIVQTSSNRIKNTRLCWEPSF